MSGSATAKGPDYDSKPMTRNCPAGRILELFAIWPVMTLALAACGERAPAGSNAGAAGNWQLESGTVGGRPVPLVPGYRITLFIDGDNATGTSACNLYGTEVRTQGGSFSISEIEGTAIGCQPEILASEDAYLSALQSVDTFASDGETLTLSGHDASLRFTSLPPVPEADVVGRVWTLEAMLDEGESRPVRGDEATLELSADGTLSGSTGCRTLTGTWVVRGDEILATTLSAHGGCSKDLADQDGHVVGVIGDGFTVAVEGDRLTLTHKGNLGLVYRIYKGNG